MIGRGEALQVVDGGADFPEYPYAADLRLPTHHFLPWQHRRWLNSRMRLLGRLEVRAIAIDLFSISQDQTPVGTLPNDAEELCILLNVSPQIWDDLARLDIPPLYGWYECKCGDEIRLAHPVVLEMIGEALNKRQEAAARATAGQQRMRLKRLADTMQRVAGGSSRLAANPAAVERVAEWLDSHCESGKWSATWVERAMGEVCS